MNRLPLTTIETITDKQIRTLREEAIAASDYALADICQRALCGDGDTQDQDGNDIAFADFTRDWARQVCVDASRNGDEAH